MLQPNSTLEQGVSMLSYLQVAVLRCPLHLVVHVAALSTQQRHHLKAAGMHRSNQRRLAVLVQRVPHARPALHSSKQHSAGGIATAQAASVGLSCKSL